jgi:hypothetical protein
VPVPQNVLAEIREWIGRYGLLRIERVEEAPARRALRAAARPTATPCATSSGTSRSASSSRSIPAAASSSRPLARGSIKQALIKIGFPVDDRGGYVAGDPLDVRLRDVTVGGRPFALRAYQRMAAQAFWAGGSVLGGSGVVVLPCGAGKTVVGMAVMSMVGSKTLILTTNTVAVRQWREELLDKTALRPDEIGEYTGDEKVVAPVTISTYQMLTWRRARTDGFEHIGLFSRQNFGLVVYDEVHLLPAPVFRVTADLQARRRLGPDRHARARGRQGGRGVLPDRPEALRRPVEGPREPGLHRRRRVRRGARVARPADADDLRRGRRARQVPRREREPRQDPGRRQADRAARRRARPRDRPVPRPARRAGRGTSRRP